MVLAQRIIIVLVLCFQINVAASQLPKKVENFGSASAEELIANLELLAKPLEAKLRAPDSLEARLKKSNELLQQKTEEYETLKKAYDFACNQLKEANESNQKSMITSIWVTKRFYGK